LVASMNCDTSASRCSTEVKQPHLSNLGIVAPLGHCQHNPRPTR
jgi:hypothetical protein